MKEKWGSCVMVGDSTSVEDIVVYNKRTRLIVESISYKFDEIKEMKSGSQQDELHHSIRLKSLGTIRQTIRQDDYKAKGLWKNKTDEDSTVVATKHDLLPKDGLKTAISLMSTERQDYVASARRFVDPDHPVKVYLLRKAYVWIKAQLQELCIR
ncbi:hypothetical protein Tco_0590152 [Tanacetum coccineum]